MQVTSYPEVYSKLNYETAILTFLKKDGTVRVMLGTRNLNTVSLLYGFQGGVLGGHDNRCNINNGNIAVFDLLIGDARSFAITRLIDIQFLGCITDVDKLNEAMLKYKEYEVEYNKSKPSEVNIDTI